MSRWRPASVEHCPVEQWDRRAVRFRGDIVGVLHLRDIGVSNDEVSWQRVLAAFAFVRLLSAVPVTPGGLGLVELGLTAALGSGLPDQTKAQIAAAVLLYRALMWLLPVALGVGCWIFWRTNQSWRSSLDDRQQLVADAEPVIAPASTAPSIRCSNSTSTP